MIVFVLIVFRFPSDCILKVFVLRVDPREYEVPFFREMGFVRVSGESCKEYYWTLDPERFREPQDAPCVDYWFDLIPSRGGLSVSDSRGVFIDFFLRRGHSYVPPRPVVARWREDLYLTIASIVVFQPHVTSGLVPPPANPLVISQPSIRLEDIDNVGLTIGRHLTSFEMAAHHAFNYPDKYVYWKDETVRYAYEFFTKELGIPGDLIVFKESWWEGGGNAGPCFEVAVGGLELATLVFMVYKVVDGRYEEIPIKIVDTGYGVERITWFTQKTPTAFHAIYGALVDKFRGLIGLERPEEALLKASFKAAGKLEPGDPRSIESYYSRVASVAGVDVGYARSVLAREARLYSLLDHTKTLALMLGDGIVPSNAGEGYLARLVARRALRQLRLLASNAKLADLVDLQISFWSRDFPQLAENRDYIVEAVELEESKFRESIERGVRVLEREIRRKGGVSVGDLVKFYDSMGVPPEVVEDVASKMGVSVEVPHNFYSMVAAMHRAPPTIKPGYAEVEVVEGVARWASTLAATRKLYYENPYMREFESTVLGVMGNYVVLDATAFYPIGGGQVYDTGLLVVGGRMYRVRRVFTVGDVVVHEVEDASGLSEGLRVKGVIDWRRRYKIMRHHTATHVILAAARRVLGPHVWQAGAEKTEEKGRLDITHHKPLTEEEVRRVEELANMIVDERRPVKVYYMDRGEAESKLGLTIYQGGAPLVKTLRVVEIEGWDVEACGGTHLANTGEIGGVKIVNVERIQDGVIRLEYVAGTRVAEKAGELELKLAGIASVAGAGRGQEVERVKALVSSLEELENALRTYRGMWLKTLREELARASPVKGVRVLVVESPERDRGVIQEILRKLSDEFSDSLIAIIYGVGDRAGVEIACGGSAAKIVDVGVLARSLAERLGGRGGGSRSYGSLTVKGRIDVGRVKEVLEDLI